MTKERAIDLCKAIDIYLCTGNPIWDVEEIHDAMSMAIEALQEQKTGKWIKKSNTNPYWTEWWYECSECCHTPLHDRYRQEELTNFCPNCGAYMRGEEE